MIWLNYCFHSLSGLSTSHTFIYLYLNTQETDVQKLQDKLNSGHIEEVILQVKWENWKVRYKRELWFSVFLRLSCGQKISSFPYLHLWQNNQKKKKSENDLSFDWDDHAET